MCQEFCSRRWCILAFIWTTVPPCRPPLGRHHPRQTSPRQSPPLPQALRDTVNILVYMQFSTKILQIHRLVRPPRELTPPGKSWVRHCIVQQYIYRPQTMLAKVMLLHLSVILFTGPQCMLGYHTPPAPQPPTPCAEHAGRCGQHAGGMHPTGMQFCSCCFCS